MRAFIGFPACFIVTINNLVGPAMAQEDLKVVHYARSTTALPIRNNQVLPVGGEIPIKYDAGEGWIPFFGGELPWLPKSAAVIIPSIVFIPPIDAVTNKLTALSQRVTLPRSRISSVMPNSSGNFIDKDEPIKIIRREGDFYFVSSRTFTNVMVPVSAVDVSSTALATGKAVAVPLAPPAGSKDPTTTPPPAGPWALYGKLKIPYTLNGKALSEGSFVSLVYDVGEEWLLSPDLNKCPQHISKKVVDVVQRLNFFSPLVGRIKSQTPVYIARPDLYRESTSLEQTPPSWSLPRLSVKIGDIVFITAREGTDYLIEFHLPNPGMSSVSVLQAGRVPVSSIDLVAGSIDSGSPTFVPSPAQSAQIGVRPPVAGSGAMYHPCNL